ncbi:glutamine--tRNA (Gln) ligase [Parastagonospora nodorum]|nr:glutamine--tRNA (Gln) ligase [Parastagonospora nodorum]KAH5392137.1 glutamine--tRNA (Gln) ligase [Parastagonospora nodorum]KAH5422142.1 glutamine--tRNA (Gln) ligase [Parastagonospora nodorum]KAH5527477.1 glutamine--tRNA (Gln) ligase [Parastagonospora nodorum]KAH5555357.1 glutamine--tRNA (Gln) ligase [Parastagonospora nodorum]
MSFPLLLRPRVPAYTCRSCLLRLSQASRRPISSNKARQIQANTAIPSTPARTRFAPSPTGYLHLGSLRTALFNYLLAKRTGGQFLLRIEDTDQKRTVPDAERRLFEDLRWAGLQWDEGPEVEGPYGPYKQSERSEIYKKHAQQLLDTGHAYRCFCSSERLNALAEHKHKLGLATDYDRTCADMAKEESDDRAHKGESHTIRLKVPDQYPKYHDLVYGTFKPLKKRGHVVESSFEDPILLKSDGLPTYHLANVVDDHLMKITHVIRGLEWMPSTPKHIAMYSAFGWTPPEFAHVGLLVDEHGNKLSKRNFDTDITAFKEMEIFPETLTNFAALLGWSHKEKTDIMDLDTLVKNFTLKFTKGNTTVTFGKLHFLQRKHAAIRAAAGGPKMQEMVANVARLLLSPDSPYKEWNKVVRSPVPDEYIAGIIKADAENYTDANEFLYRNSFFFQPLRPYHEAPPVSTTSDVPMRCQMLKDVAEEDWTRENLMAKVVEIIDGRVEGKAGSKHVYHYLRMMLTGQEKGMRLYDVMLILGRKETLARLGVEM